jgi:hypoxanthine phosphoribosyltransferase
MKNIKSMKSDMLSFVSKDEIKKMIKDLAKQIESDFPGKELILVCPLKGSVHFTADLCREIKNPLHIDFVRLMATEKGGSIKIMKDITVNIKDKHVFIVEEIIDTARTLSFLRTRILASQPASLKIVTLLDKPARRELPIRPDYVGKTIDDRYVVGYGMDQDELGRNYSDIYIMKN